MKLFTQEILKDLPRIGETAGQEDPIVRVKLFYPDFGWTWYIIEYNPEEQIAYGLVEGFETELGDFSIAELEENRGKLGCTIERDMYWQPRPLSQLRKEIGR